MTRRDLFRKLFITPLAVVIGVKTAPTFTYDKTKINFFHSSMYAGENVTFCGGITYHPKCLGIISSIEEVKGY